MSQEYIIIKPENIEQLSQQKQKDFYRVAIEDLEGLELMIKHAQTDPKASLFLKLAPQIIEKENSSRVQTLLNNFQSLHFSFPRQNNWEGFLYKWIANHPGIKNFSLQTFGENHLLPVVSFVTLCKKLSRHSLATLRFSSVILLEKESKELFDLKFPVKLGKIHLHNVAMDLNSFEKLMQYFASLQTLFSLFLDMIQVFSEKLDMQRLDNCMRSIFVDSSLHELAINLHVVTPGKSLRFFPNVEMMERSKIKQLEFLGKNSSSKELFVALCHNTSLESLGLHYFNLTNEDCNNLAEFINQSDLKILRFNRCYFSVNIKDLIKPNDTIVQFTAIHCRGLNDAGVMINNAQLFGEFIGQLLVLKKLHIEDNGINPKVIHDWPAAINSHHSLIEFIYKFEPVEPSWRISTAANQQRAVDVLSMVKKKLSENAEKHKVLEHALDLLNNKKLLHHAVMKGLLTHLSQIPTANVSPERLENAIIKLTRSLYDFWNKSCDQEVLALIHPELDNAPQIENQVDQGKTEDFLTENHKTLLNIESGNKPKSGKPTELPQGPNDNASLKEVQNTFESFKI